MITTNIPTSTPVPFEGLLVDPRLVVFDDDSTVDVRRTSIGGAQNTLGADLDPKGTEIQPNLTSSLSYNLPRPNNS